LTESATKQMINSLKLWSFQWLETYVSSFWRWKLKP